MRYPTVIFDLDGTLIDTSELIFDAVRHLAIQLGLPVPSRQQMQVCMGPPLELSLTKVFGPFSPEQMSTAIAIYRKRYDTVSLAKTRAFAHTEQLLQALRAVGVQIAAASLKYQPTAEQTLRGLGLLDYFDALAASNDRVDTTKAQLIERVLARLHTAPASAVLVGDSAYDAAGAQQVGMDFIAMLQPGGGFCTRQEILPHHPVFIATGMPQLQQYLLGV